MAKGIDELIKDCLEYINENRPQSDWVSYSGPILDDDDGLTILYKLIGDWTPSDDQINYFNDPPKDN